MKLTRIEQIASGANLTPLTRKEASLKAAIKRGIEEPSGGGGSSDPYSAYDVVIIKPEDGEYEVVKGDYAEIHESIGFRPTTAVYFNYGVYGGDAYCIVCTGQTLHAQEGYIYIEFNDQGGIINLYWLADGSVSEIQPE